MTLSKLVRIMIVDDHPVTRCGLIAVIEQEKDMQIVSEAENGSKALEQLPHCRPDMILMDLHLPLADSLEAIEAIRSQFPDVHVLILADHHGAEDVYRSLQAGAKGYLFKDTPRQELLDSIRQVAAGQFTLSRHAAQRLAEYSSYPRLTPREQEILDLLARGESNQQIASTLFIAEGTVKSHINSIFGKMKVSDRTQAVTTAIKRGMIHLET